MLGSLRSRLMGCWSLSLVAVVKMVTFWVVRVYDLSRHLSFRTFVGCIVEDGV